MSSLSRSMVWLTDAGLLDSPAALIPAAQAYDLQCRLTGTKLTPSQLHHALSRGLPSRYDQLFPDQQWTTYLLIDVHPN